MTPQNVNHYSLAQVQVNNYKHPVYNKGNFMQQFDSVVQYNAITLSVLLKEYYSYKLQFGAYSNFKYNVNHKG
jgi:hypothetical protein